MPTQRPRLTVTETPDVAARLDVAAAHFPALAGSRKQLLLRLTELGVQTLQSRDNDSDLREASKRRILERTRAITPEEAQALLAAREADWRHDLGS